MRALLAIVLILAVSACDTVPITGRQQLTLISNGEINAMAAREYRRFIKESEVVRGTPDARLVRSVGEKIRAAVERYFDQRGERDLLQGFRWEFSLVEDDEINAFCMPGGKVAVNTGMLPVSRTEAGLAVVMGHEIAHAVAGHGNERLSQQLLVWGAGTMIGALVEDEENPELGGALALALGLGAEVGVLLPFSRLHESEADRLGLIFMAMAGYDPREAPKFWRRMSRATGGDGAPEFLSTHPSDETRASDLEKAVPEALAFAGGARAAAGAAASAARDDESRKRRTIVRRKRQ